MRSSVKLTLTFAVFLSLLSVEVAAAEDPVFIGFATKIDPKGHYLTTQPGDVAKPATSIPVGEGTPFPVGTKIWVRTRGRYNPHAPNGSGSQYETADYAMLVFKGPSGFLHPGPGSGFDYYDTNSCAAWSGKTSSDILEDSWLTAPSPDHIPGANYYFVPEGATEILVSVAPADCGFWKDRADNDNDFYLEIFKEHVLLDADKIKLEQNSNDNTRDNCKECHRSEISIDNQVLMESIPLPKSGEANSLHYASDRTFGYKPPYRTTVPVPADSSMVMKVFVGAAEVASYLGISTRYVESFYWDGLDSNGNIVPNPRRASFVWIPKAHTPGSWRSSQSAVVGTFHAKQLGFGGWTFSAHHHFDFNAGRIYMGTGESRVANWTHFKHFNGRGIVSENGSEVYEFDFLFRHLKTRNAKTGAVLRTFSYDGAGLLEKIEDAFGNETLISRSGSQIVITGPYGHQTTLTLDGNGYLASVTLSGGQVYTVAHGSSGLLSSFQKPSGATHSFTYDSLGRLTEDSGPLGRSVSFARSSALMDSPVSRTTSENRTLSLSFGRDQWNNYLRTELHPHGETKQMKTSSSVRETLSSDGWFEKVEMSNDPRLGYSSRFPYYSERVMPSGLKGVQTTSRTFTLSDPQDTLSVLTETTDVDSNGQLTRAEYRSSDGRTQITSPENRISAVFTDVYGRVTKQEQTGIEPVFSYYDTRGRLEKTVQGDRETEYTYDSDGNLASIENALGFVTSMLYDSSGRMTSATKPDSSVTSFTYDLNSNLTSLTPPGKPAHEILLDALNRVVEMISPNLNALNPVNLYRDVFQYNTDNETTKVTKASGSVSDFIYQTGNDRLRRIETQNGDYEYSYLPKSRRIESVSSPYGVSTGFEYDGSLLKSATQTGAAKGKVEFNYDSFFRVAQSKVYGIDGQITPISTVDHWFDNDGLLVSAGPLTITRHLTTGFITGTQLGGVSDTRSYNTFGEITYYEASFAGSLLYSYSLTRDKLGRITKKIEDIGGVETTYDYVYSSVGRLIEVKTNGSTTGTYTYNSNGGRTMTSDHGHSHAGVFDDQDRMTQLGDLQFTYNLDGQLQSRTDSSISEAVNYVYDAQGNLLSVALPGSCTISYVTDGMNRRVAKKHNGDLEDQYVFEDSLRIAGKLDASGNLVQRYVYGTMSHSPDVILENGRTLRVITDHLGSPRLIVNSQTGEILRSMNHDAWGRVLEDSNPMFSPHGFAGGIYDTDTKLVRFGARDYNPEAGSWTSKDPISFQGGDTNLYGYVGTDPVNFVDASGLIGLDPGRQPNNVLTNPLSGGAGGGGGGAALALVSLVQWTKDYFNASKKPTSLPKEGPPDGTLIRRDKDGNIIQERQYDQNRNPVRDIDYSHDHGQGVPHQHDWKIIPGVGPVRQPGTRCEQ